ncbi:MAG: UDP-N-acetylglucosamine--N-acetylmuramyl-(pentapeptide) pyrophosphoryl-undecaprenol N-acetylglucosamine transferase, partial [Planctomycetes bacterium]|nr:UDP-N-acetylglucosamine--N-acetylmuramyl-(pentapeptide) pyrophosphoryl-undecaprenol N-acetylglucosamine transferase [Planctomycetota bacterium]
KNAATVNVVGCPLRSGFDNPQPAKAIEQLGLDENKKILLVTGASSGAVNVNKIICSLLEKLNDFAGNWQIVHLTGRADFENVNAKYIDAEINYKLLDYYDNMPDLLNAADLVIGRSGAVSVAEYAAAVLPAICIPYPYHKDKHQYLNAAKLVEAGSAVIVDDLAVNVNSAQLLWQKLKPLMENENELQQMKTNYTAIANTNAALQIAERLLEFAAK